MTYYEAMKNKNIYELLRKLDNYKKLLNYNFNGVYGCDELKVSLSPAEFDFAFEQIVCKVVDNWTPDKMQYSNRTVSINSYLHTSIEGEIKRYICKVNNVSPYYAEMLVAVKGQNLDIWNENDVPAIKKFLTGKGYKDVDNVFCNLREQFTYAQPKNTKKHFGMVQLRKLVADTLKIDNARADEVILLYYSGLNLWNDTEGIDFVRNELQLQYPITKLRKLRVLLDQNKVASLFTYLNACSLPDKAQLKEKKKVTKPVTVDDLLIAEVTVRASKLVRKTKLTTREEKLLTEKCDITGYYGAALKELHAHGMNLWKNDPIDLAAVALLVYPDCKKPCQFVQKLMAYDSIMVDVANKIFDTATKSDTKASTVTVAKKKETKTLA